MDKNMQEKPLSNTELASFFYQMSVLTASGVSATEAVDSLLEDSTSDHEKRILESLRENLLEMKPFHECLQASALFPDYAVRMTSLGEETGNLSETMKALSAHFERENEIARTVRNAVIFPSVMALMMLVVIFVLLTRVMPIFSQVYKQLGTEMSGVSLVLLNLGKAFGNYTLLFIILVVIFMVFMLLGTATESGKAYFRKLEEKFRLNRALREKLAAGRFAEGMAISLRAGLDSERAAELSAALSESPELSEKTTAMTGLLSEGQSLYTAIRDSKLFTGIHLRMIHVGEKTGTTDAAMEQIASQLKSEADDMVSRKLEVLEPAIVIILSVFVGVILLSVMMPLMGIMSKL